MTKKIFAMFLAVLMVVSMLPTTVFAANECPGAGNHTKDNCDCTVVKVVDPSCGSYGYTTYKCNKCKETFADDIVPATGEHSMVAGEAKAPTCGAAGYEAGMECENCDYVVPGAPIKPLFKEGTACEYKDMTPDINCTTGGVKTFECVACGHTYTKKVSKGSHAWNFDKYTVKVAPTEDEAGIIVIPCDKCSATKEAEWFNDHDCAESVQWHKPIAANCKTGMDGAIGHWECRACGKLFGGTETAINMDVKYVPGELWNNPATVEIEGRGVILKATHTPNKTIKCYDQDVECTVCETEYVLTGEHDYSTMTTVQNADCINAGYKTGVCSRCNLPVIEVIPAQGHVAHTVSVPATCGTYAYTFTVCMRENCSKFIPDANNNELSTEWLDKNNVHYNVSLGYVPADKLLVNDYIHYNLGVYDATYDEFVPYDEELSLEAVVDYKGDVVEGKFYIKLSNGKYLTIAEQLYGTYGYIGAYYIPVKSETTDAQTAFAMNEEFGILTASLKRGEYALFYDWYEEEFVVDSIEEITYPYYQAAELSWVTSNGLHLVNIKVDEKGGYDETKHNLTAEYLQAPSCTVEGSVFYHCVNHGCLYQTTINVGKDNHRYGYLIPGANSATNQAMLDAIINAGFNATLTTMYKANTCTTSGWAYKQCIYCGAIEKQILPAYGHYFDTAFAPTNVPADHNTVGYDYWECANGCGEIQQINVEAWKDMNKTWDTYEDAVAAHPGIGAKASGILYRAGDCETTGLVKYVCNGTDKCGKVVYVKQWKTLKDKNGDPVSDEFGNVIEYMTGSHTVKPFRLAANLVIDEVVVLTAGTWIVDFSLPMYESLKGVAGYANYRKDATCEEKGYLFTYTCACCDEVVGNSTNGEAAVLNKTAHKWGTTVSDEFNPCPNGVPFKCEICGVDRDIKETTIGNNPCEKVIYEYYVCSCGEEHVRGVYGKFGHEFIIKLTGNDADGNPYAVAPTHTATGYETYQCTYCNETKKVTLDKTPHKNADGEKFTDACTDTVTDRHCVLCCTHEVLGNKHDCTTLDANKDGRLDCACMIGKTHHGKVNTYKDSTCSMMPYYFFICKDCDGTIVTVIDEAISSTELKKWTAESDRLGVDVYYFFDKTDIYVMDGEEIVDIELPYTAVNFKGHKPAKIDYDKDGNEIRYANYVYVEGYEWTSYNWELVAVPYLNEDGVVEFFNEYVLVETVETYTAKFEKFEAPSYAADGGFKAHCQICDASVEQVLPKKSGLGFEMSFANANGQSGFGYGSLVEVTVSANALNANIYGFNFSVEENMPGMIFVGYEAVNDDFVVVVSDPSVVAKTGEVEIIGHAVNSAEGKMQNIAITEKTALVKLYYRVAGDAGKCTFSFADASAQLVKNATTKTLANIDANYEEAKITVRGLLDFNKDAAASVADLYQAMALLTGEMANGATYDVTVDLNKDGEVTLEDLSIGYNYLVGNITSTQLLFTGMDADETELFLHLMGAYAHKCISPFCDYAQADEFDYCPACGFKQK